VTAAEDAARAAFAVEGVARDGGGGDGPVDVGGGGCGARAGSRRPWRRWRELRPTEAVGETEAAAR